MNNKDLERAIYFATTKHLGQTRRDNVMPYVVHPIEVMKFLYNAGIVETDLLIAAVLHDTIEDTKTEECEIENAFGATTLKYVKEVTRIGVDDETIDEKIKFLRSFDGTKSVGGSLLKLADRYCNISDFRRNDKRKWFSAYYALQAYPLYNWFFTNLSDVQTMYGQRVSSSFEHKIELMTEKINRAYGGNIISLIFGQGAYKANDDAILEILKKRENGQIK